MSRRTLSADLLQEVTAARRGDREALGRVLALMRPYLLAVEKGRGKAGLGQAGCNGEAEDLVQEAICHAVRSFPQFAGTTAEELRGWLRQILLNAARDWDKHWRADRRHPRREVAADDDARLKEQLTARANAPVAEMIRQEKISTIRLTLEQLKPEHREVIRLRCREELAFEEIGVRLGRTKDAARKLWERALADLKWRLQRMREEDSDFQDAPGRAEHQG
jgi:RNA polymerase sigma-70 factor (subfamily 1)